MERKKDAKASTAAIRTCRYQSLILQRLQPTHRSLAVCEAALEGGHDHVFMLLLDDLRGCREYPKGILALCLVLRLTCLEQCAQ
jgi:hypothetical protein